jgi:hypothetical protein
MKYFYECENDYCNHSWYSGAKWPSEECPYCGCKYLKREKMPEAIQPATKVNKKKKKKRR